MTIIKSITTIPTTTLPLNILRFKKINVMSTAFLMMMMVLMLIVMILIACLLDVWFVVVIKNLVMVLFPIKWKVCDDDDNNNL